ncbi:MAG TPA: helix-turn-helix domain-containing protein [Nitrososphaeraceae archaeon]
MNNGPTEKDILFILTDESSLQIMKLLDKKQLSAQIISSTLNIPISTTYRKIKKLEQLKIIKVTKVVRTLDGLDESFYSLWMNEIKISYKDHKFSINIRLLPSDEKIVRLWQKFKN